MTAHHVGVEGVRILDPDEAPSHGPCVLKVTRVTNSLDVELKVLAGKIAPDLTAIQLGATCRFTPAR